MTGLDNILNQIRSDAQQEADQILAKAKETADGILDKAKEDADRDGKTILADGEAQAQDIRARAESSAQLERRNAMLSFKQEVIRAAADKAIAQLEAAPDEEYFSMLLALAGRYAAPGKAEMLLNEKDLARLPADFAAALKQAAPQAEITVSKEPATGLDSGFLLRYEGIDVNCGIRALLEDAQGEVRDSLSRILFPEKESS